MRESRQQKRINFRSPGTARRIGIVLLTVFCMLAGFLPARQTVYGDAQVINVKIPYSQVMKSSGRRATGKVTYALRKDGDGNDSTIASGSEYQFELTGTTSGSLTVPIGFPGPGFYYYKVEQVTEGIDCSMGSQKSTDPGIHYRLMMMVMNKGNELNLAGNIPSTITDSNGGKYTSLQFYVVTEGSGAPSRPSAPSPTPSRTLMTAPGTPLFGSAAPVRPAEPDGSAVPAETAAAAETAGQTPAQSTPAQQTPDAGTAVKPQTVNAAGTEKTTDTETQPKTETPIQATAPSRTEIQPQTGTSTQSSGSLPADTSSRTADRPQTSVPAPDGTAAYTGSQSGSTVQRPDSPQAAGNAGSPQAADQAVADASAGNAAGTDTSAAAGRPSAPAASPEDASVLLSGAAESDPETSVISKLPEPVAQLGTYFTDIASAADSWSLINLLAMILGAAVSLLIIITGRRRVIEDDEEEEIGGSPLRFLVLIPAICSVILFFLTEDLTSAMRMTDQWTIWMILILIINLILAVLLMTTRKMSSEPGEEGAV